MSTLRGKKHQQSQEADEMINFQFFFIFWWILFRNKRIFMFIISVDKERDGGIIAHIYRILSAS